MIRRNILALSTFAAALALSAGSLAGPMSDAEFRRVIEQYDSKMMELRTNGQAKKDRVVALQAETNADLPIRDLPIEQLRQLADKALITTYEPGSEGDRSAEAIAALDAIIEQGGVDAVDALSVKANLLAWTREKDEELRAKIAKITSTILTHQQFGEAAREGRIGGLWYTVAYEIPKDTLASMSQALQTGAAAFPTNAPLASTQGMVAFYDAANATKDESVAAAAETFRVKAVESLEKVVAENDSQSVRNASRELDLLEAAPRIAKLVGNPAPELDFTWVSDDEPFTSLADLRGNVVVLDFWATWCGPCIASFPQVRELVEHYQGYPVKVVGVTSPQGTTYLEAGPEQAATHEEEFEQMARFIEERDINWTIGFTAQEVFNPDYGVRGIPHVVIIDPEGKIAHRALHPAGSLAKKAALIDPILDEFGLEHPPTPKEEVAKAGE